MLPKKRADGNCFLHEKLIYGRHFFPPSKIYQSLVFSKQIMNEQPFFQGDNPFSGASPAWNHLTPLWELRSGFLRHRCLAQQKLVLAKDGVFFLAGGFNPFEKY